MLLCCSCAGGAREATAPSIVPLRSLRLYETGVGYFERTGAVAEDASLPVPTSHLDDALKSLVILGQGGKIDGLTFPSNLSRPMAKALLGITSGSDSLALPALLEALKGADVEITQNGSDERLRGKLIERTEEQDPGPAEGEKKGEGARVAGAKRSFIVVLTEQGALRKINLESVKEVRPLDPRFTQRLSASLDATAPRGAQMQRALKLLGKSSGPVTFGYIAETPVWRSSYRIILDGSGGKFQGWALLHNDTEEDWQGVKLALVNGRPDSFLFPMASPRYLRRELVRPDQPMPTTPQLLHQRPDDLWLEAEEGEAFGAGGLGLSGVGEGGGGRGEGIGLGSIGTVGHGSGTGSSLLSVGNLASLAQATGQEQGALFQFSVERPITLPAHSSALVPFLEQTISTKLLTWIDNGARVGLRFENSTGQTLPAGTMAIFHGGGFAGETTLDRLKPGERRFLTFGADLDVELLKHGKKSLDETQRTLGQEDSIQEHFLRTTEHTVEIKNRSPQPRSVYLVLRLNQNAKVTGADELDYDAERSKPVAIFHVAPGQTLQRSFVSVEGLSRSFQADRVTVEELQRIIDAPKLPANERTALQGLSAQRAEQIAHEKTVAQQAEDIKEAQQELERLRKHLEAMGGDKSLRPDQNPFVRRILAAEDRLTELKKKHEALQAQGKLRASALQAALRKLPSSL